MSNLSYMKRVMMLVLPTDWSPKKTSLYLARGDTVAIFYFWFCCLRVWVTRNRLRSEPESLKLRESKKRREGGNVVDDDQHQLQFQSTMLFIHGVRKRQPRWLPHSIFLYLTNFAPTFLQFTRIYFSFIADF